MIQKSARTNSALLFVLFLLCVFPGRADTVDNYLPTQMRERHIPGAAIAVIKNGKVIKAEGYGLANVESNDAAGESCRNSKKPDITYSFENLKERMRFRRKSSEKLSNGLYPNSAENFLQPKSFVS